VWASTASSCLAGTISENEWRGLVSLAANPVASSAAGVRQACSVQTSEVVATAVSASTNSASRQSSPSSAGDRSPSSLTAESIACRTARPGWRPTRPLKESREPCLASSDPIGFPLPGPFARDDAGSVLLLGVVVAPLVAGPVVPAAVVSGTLVGGLVVAGALVCGAVLGGAVDDGCVEVAWFWEAVDWAGAEVGCVAWIWRSRRAPLALAVVGTDASRAAIATAASRRRGGNDRCMEVNTGLAVTARRADQTGASSS
jgi:hypothetical protein